MTPEQFKSIVALARFAPSAHNTQPARWSLRPDGRILISVDLARRLPVGDPDDRDLKIAAGAAVEGTVLALALHGLGAKAELIQAPEANGHRPVALVSPSGPPLPEDGALSAFVEDRVTDRRGFASPNEPIALDHAHACVTAIQDPEEIHWLSTEIDRASARIMQDKAFRSELLDWMRLSPRDPRYLADGLTPKALAMDAVTAKLLRPILASPLYRLLCAFGLGPSLSGEAARSRTACGVLLFHWPKNGNLIEAGRFFYRTWLSLTAKGLVGWPAAALADDSGSATQIMRRYHVSEEHFLFNALRVGPPQSGRISNTRLSTDDVIIDA